MKNLKIGQLVRFTKRLSLPEETEIYEVTVEDFDQGYSLFGIESILPTSNRFWWVKPSEVKEVKDKEIVELLANDIKIHILNNIGETL